MAMPVITLNPVLRRELVERMRGWRACAILTAYLALLATALFISYQAGQNQTDSPFEFADSSVNQVASVGRGIFEWLLVLMFALVLFLVPGQTSGAIAGERERQTLVPLQVTLLRPRSIMLGKIGAALAFLALMIVATMPLLSLCFLIGGVSFVEVVGGVAMVLFLGVVVACISTAISALVRRVQLATVLSYGAVLFLTAGTFAIRWGVSALDESRGIDSANPPSWLMLPNPFMTLADVADDGEDNFNALRSPIDPFEKMLREDESGGFSQDTVDGNTIVVAGRGGFPDATQFDDFGNPIVGSEKSSFWWQSMLVLSLISIACVVVGSLRLRTPARSER